jgi:hypothetical protein
VIVVFLTPVSTVERVYWASTWLSLHQATKSSPSSCAFSALVWSTWLNNKQAHSSWFLSILLTPFTIFPSSPSRWYAMSWLFTLQLLLFSGHSLGSPISDSHFYASIRKC